MIAQAGGFRESHIIAILVEPLWLAVVLWLDLDRRSSVSLTQQLYDQLGSRILAGELKAGERLPSSRALADELGIARNVAVQVFEQLQAEGYLESRAGSGTFVAALELPSSPPRRLRSPKPPAPLPGAPEAGTIGFRCGVPDLAAFPRARWLHAERQVGFHSPADVWSYNEVGGLQALREEIAAYLGRVKSIRCSAEQVVMTQSSTSGILLLGLFFRTRGAGALIEDPVIRFVPRILQQCGLRVHPVPADADGLVIEALPRRPREDFVFVSPSHQFPLGGTMPIARRLALLDYARRHDLFVVEDDYDSEFRFTGAPVSSLCRLDPARVIHLGTFSKSLAPAMRLGYLVLPPALAPQMLAMLRPMSLAGSRVTQAVVARLMQAGHFQRHVTRMKRVYQRKMETLCAALRSHFGDEVTITGNTTGLHLVARFRGVAVTPAVRKRCAEAGVRFDMVDDYALASEKHGDVVLLGFGNLSLEQIEEGVRRLASVLRAA